MEETNGEKRETQRLPPLLLISHGKPNNKQSFYSLSENRFHTRIIPELVNKCVFASAYGWLVLADHDTDNCCVWNPSSKEIIQLPVLKYSVTYNKCILSKPPTDPDCYILFLSSCNSHLAFCRVGDDISECPTLSGDMLNYLTAASFQGKIYCYTRHGRPDPWFFVAHFVGRSLELRPMLQWHVFPNKQPPSWTAIWKSYLTESVHGELLLVDEITSCSLLHDGGVLFRVFRVDIDRKECVELQDIGDQAIFISLHHCSGDSGICCSSSHGIKSNSIYYTVPNNRNLYIYDLNDRSQTVLLPCRAARGSELKSCWVEHHSFQKEKIN